MPQHYCFGSVFLFTFGKSEVSTFPEELSGCNTTKQIGYIGEFKYRDIIVPDGIHAIGPQDLFDRVQTKLEKNKKPRRVTRPRTIIC